MLFNSLNFLIFFPITVLIFFVVPKRLRHLWLLIASYFFYMSWNPRYALLMALSTVITYVGGILIEKLPSHKKAVLAASFVFNLAILAIFKYADFALETFDRILRLFNMTAIDRRLDLLLPVGISFYTFQALGYTMDVYRGSIKAEKNILKYALFVSFFPQLVAGPIERSGNLMKQIRDIKNKSLFSAERIKEGLLLMLWGFFQKLVIADRISVIVNPFFAEPEKFGFFEAVLAVFLFAFQIYCDFGGYTDIARGAARVMGFELMHNFRQPYMAENIKEFWRRWHISLTSWFTDYLYIPLGGSRKGRLRKYLNIFVVFLVSGLWHGAAWNFVVWGCLHGVYQIVGNLKNDLYKSLGIKKGKPSLSRKILNTAVTFALVDFAWAFFASDGLRTAVIIIKKLLSPHILLRTTGLWGIGTKSEQPIILLLSVAVLFAVDFIHEKGISVFDAIKNQMLWFRWLLYLGLIWSVVILGAYGAGYDTSQFIYFQF